MDSLLSTIKALLLVAGTTAGSAIVMAIAWGALDWMRHFPAPVPVLPDFFHSRTRYEPPPSGAVTPLEALATSIINWYNLTFIGATRFGSGLGIIAGGIWSLTLVKGFPRVARVLAGLIGGALIGGRLALMLGSFPRTFLGSTICGALIGALIMMLVSDQKHIPELPDVGPRCSGDE